MNKKAYSYLALIIAIFAFGYFVGIKDAGTNNKIVGSSITKTVNTDKVDLSLFWNVWDLIKSKYVNNVDNQTMVYGAIKGMVQALGDPYSNFMDPEESKEFLQDMKGSFEGIGAEIGIRDGALTIISPLKGMPAEKAGLLPGDKVIKINDTPTLGMGIEKAVRLIRGPRGTIVNLTVLRNDKPKQISIIRNKIDLLSVKWEMKKNNIAYLDISSFQQDTGTEFSIAAAQILLKSPKGIILDLRNNPGGYLDVAVNIAGWFVDKGSVVAIEDFGKSKEQQKYYASGHAQFKDYPIVVLVNKGSASASEILAGALRDLRGIKLIGEKTFGKGSVQELESLQDNSNLKISVAKWLTPNAYCINKKGLIPDIEVKDDIKTKQDEVLDKAISFITQLAITNN